MPNSVSFETLYAPGKVEAISFCGGKEISRGALVTAGAPAKILLKPEKAEMKADGHDLIYVGIEIQDKDGNLVPDAEIALTAKAGGCAVLSGFGSGNPVTEEDYTDEQAVSYRGRAMAILRSGYEKGRVCFAVSGEQLATVELELRVI